MKKIVINLLALGLIGASIVACNGGGSSSPANTAPPAPAASPIAPPAGFDIPSGSPSGAAFNLSSGEIALPGASGYNVISTPSDVTAALAAAGIANVNVTSSGGNILLSMPGAVSGTTLTYVLTPLTQAAARQAQATATSAESFTYSTSDVKTNVISVPATSITPAGLGFGYSVNGDTGAAIISPNSTQQAPVYTSLNNCSGATGTPSAIIATYTNGVAYVGLGTSTGTVCVLSGANLAFTNLSTQAPAAKYTAGNVNGFGYPASLNTVSTIVGYWNVGTVGTSVNIYRVTGTYVNGAPTGNGFLNTTVGGQQTTTNGTTVVTFTGFPTNSSIYSSYTDSVGNVWVGTNAGAVYVLRTGATQWTSAALTGATGAVSVQTNGATSGATATSLVGGASQSFAVN